MGGTISKAQPPATMEAPAASFDAGTLHSFVTAFIQVDEINRAYTAQMQAADTTEEQQQIQQQATQEMVTAVENTEGINVEDYNVIMQAVQTDPALAQQINDMIRETVGE